MNRHPPFLVGAPSGIELGRREETFRVQHLKFDVSWAPAVSLAKGIYPSVPIPVFKGSFMLRISVLVFAVLFLIGCGGGSLPFIPPHSGTSGGTGSSNGSSGGGTY